VKALEALDPSSPPFHRRTWERQEGGGGISCTFSAPSDSPSSAVLEKAGVNVSMIKGVLPPTSLKQLAIQHPSVPYDGDASQSLPFFAGGISLILHPSNPNAPTVHANYRYFEITESTADDSKILAWWFGGIVDLTPYSLHEEDFRHFHQTLKDACDKHGDGLYDVFKKDCDEYFFNKHREEHRGVGGLRINDLSDEPHPLLPDSDFPNRPRTAESIFTFIKALGESFLPSYLPIIRKQFDVPYDSRTRRWQLIRRGRYVEFNLIYDRGTKFGLATPGVQVENVLISLPETARWEYMSDLGAEVDETPEGQLLAVLKQPKSWAI